MSKNHIDTLFWKTYGGENVFITSNVPQTHRVALPDGTMTETIPLYFEGILMDMDEDYLYIGDGKKIASSVKHEFILEVQIKDKSDEDEYMKYLKSVDRSENTEFN